MSVRALVISCLALALLAGALAYQRHTEAYDVLSPREITTQEINNLDYDPETGVFRVTGPDPFIYLDLPRHSIPLRELRLEFKGPAQPGGWYVYPCPAHLRQPIINQDWVVTAVAEPRGDDHTLVWTLDNSQLARIDFPDELNVPLTLERAVLTTDYASSRSSVYVGMIAAGILAGLLVLVGGLGPRLAHPAAQGTLMIVLIALKVWIASSMGQTFMTVMAHDDRLFMMQGRSIFSGEWLGPFNELTLAKGPVFPLLLAAFAATGWSLQLNVSLFHAISVVLFVVAISPWVRRTGWRMALFALLLFDPQSLSAEVIGRILRGMVQPALTLATIAGCVGMLCRTRQPLWQSLPWAVLAGLAGAAFSYSREEGIWLAPTVALLVGTAAVLRWRTTSSHRWTVTLIALIPLAVYTGGRASVRVINQAHYGMAIGVDGGETAFGEAHGAILRVTNPDPLPGAPTTAATRALIYEQSPAFAELEEFFETEMVPKWRHAGWNHYEAHARSGEEIRNGWFSWAIREAAAYHGHYATAAKADAYWQRVADEINRAVDEGRLPGGAPRSGFFPRWDESYTWPTVRGCFQALDLMVRFTDFLPHGIPSQGEPSEIAEMAAFYHVEPTLEVSAGSWDGQVRQTIARIYSWVGWPLTILALVATAWLVRNARSHRGTIPQLVVLFALWGGALALALIVSLVEATSFPAIIGAYLAPAVPLLISCWVLAPLWVWQLQSPKP